MATVNPLLQQIDAIAKEKGVEPEIIISAVQDALEAAARKRYKTEALRARFNRKSRELGLATPHAIEVFTVSAWGEVPAHDELLADLPVISRESSNLERLKSRLQAWRGGA
jgi:hypothetical protein